MKRYCMRAVDSRYTIMMYSAAKDLTLGTSSRLETVPRYITVLRYAPSDRYLQLAPLQLVTNLPQPFSKSAASMPR